MSVDSPNTLPPVVLTVRFEGSFYRSKPYDYWAPGFAGPSQVPSWTVVDTPHGGYQLVRIEEVRLAEPEDLAGLKRIVCYVDDADYKVWRDQDLCQDPDEDLDRNPDEEFI